MAVSMGFLDGFLGGKGRRKGVYWWRRSMGFGRILRLLGAVIVDEFEVVRW